MVSKPGRAQQNEDLTKGGAYCNVFKTIWILLTVYYRIRVLYFVHFLEEYVFTPQQAWRDQYCLAN